MTEIAPNLATKHEQYPDGFPPRINDDLLGHWQTPDGIVVVEHHPHGYEVHFYPCYDFETCEACAPDRGPTNPLTKDGHHFRLCLNRGPILNVAGGDAGYRAVLQYLAMQNSPPHVREFEALEIANEAKELARQESERIEHEALAAEEATFAPTVAERFSALEAEFEALRALVERKPLIDRLKRH